MKTFTKDRHLLGVLLGGLYFVMAGRLTAQTVTTLYSFTGGSDGAQPYAPLILSSNTLYGTASGGGDFGVGAVFAINTDGTTFPTLGAQPNASDAFVCSELFASGFGLPGAEEETISVLLPGANATRFASHFQVQPLTFERNEGQFETEAKFLARGPGYHLFLTPTEAVMVMPSVRRREDAKRLELQQPSAAFGVSGPGTKAPADWRSPKPGGDATGAPDSCASGAVLRLQLVGACPNASISGAEQLPGKVNYLIGNDPSRWRTNISTFAKVRYHEVYPGIDLVYYGNEGQLEYDFIVAPGAEPNRIALAIAGADKLEIDERGDLIVRVSDQEVRWHKPKIFQQINGVQIEIAGAYTLRPHDSDYAAGSTHLVSFNLAAYELKHSLVIDPVLAWGTFFGDSDSHTFAYGIAVDRDGNAYIGGNTASAQFPTKNPLQAKLTGTGDAFVTKLGPSGEMIYSTYIGGTAGAGVNRGCIATDAAGSACLVGGTSSRDFPTVNALQPNLQGTGDGFALKLKPDGAALVYSTYLGGSSGIDDPKGVVVDRAGYAYICGSTRSTDFPTVNAIQPQYGGGVSDLFVAKLNPTGTALSYSTYLGGSDRDDSLKIALDQQGAAYVAGYTASRDFPMHSAFQSGFGGGPWDSFLAKISPMGDALIFSSYFGGSGNDYIQAVGVGNSGDVYFAGLSGSTDLPTTNAIQPQLQAFGGSDGILAYNAFVARYDPISNNLVFSTYLGGSISDEATCLTLDAFGNVYVGGQTSSPDFPVTADAFQTFHAGGGGSLGLGHDAFLSALSSDGSRLIYSSFLGGSWEEEIFGMALDPQGNVYLAGINGSADFPVQNPILLNPARGEAYFCAFAAKFSPIVVPPPLMRITRSGNALSITWPVSASGFVLESADSLISPNWTPVAAPPIPSGDQQSVQLAIEGRAKFYRLRKL